MKKKEVKSFATSRLKSRKFSKLRGMKDVLFEEYKYWDLVNKKATDLARVYGFKKMETPVIESYNLFEKILGKTSEVVSKELYTFQDRSGDKVALRPESTPSLCRAYIEHEMFNQPQPIKMFWQEMFSTWLTQCINSLWNTLSYFNTCFFFTFQ